MSEERSREPGVLVPDWRWWRRFLLQFIVATLAMAGLLLIAGQFGLDTGYGVQTAAILASVLAAVLLLAAVSNPAGPARGTIPEGRGTATNTATGNDAGRPGNRASSRALSLLWSARCSTSIGGSRSLWPAATWQC